jgi:hypothetical protein
MEKEAWFIRERCFMELLWGLGVSVLETKSISKLSDSFASKRNYIIPGGLTRAFLASLVRIIGLSSRDPWIIDLEVGSGESLPTEAGIYTCNFLETTYMVMPTEEEILIPNIGNAMSAEELLFIMIRLKFDEGLFPPADKGWVVKTRNKHYETALADNILIQSYTDQRTRPRKTGIQISGFPDCIGSVYPKYHCLPRNFKPLPLLCKQH